MKQPEPLERQQKIAIFSFIKGTVTVTVPIIAKNCGWELSSTKLLSFEKKVEVISSGREETADQQCDSVQHCNLHNQSLECVLASRCQGLFFSFEL